MRNEHSVADHWAGDFDEGRLQAWAEQLRSRLDAPRVSLGLVFMSPKFFPHATQVLELLRVHARIPLLAGCSSTSLIAGDQEIEEEPGLVLGLYSLPGSDLKAAYFTQEEFEEADSPAYWHHETEIAPDQTNGWLIFADPFRMDCEGWLRSWNEAFPAVPSLGGLATGADPDQSTQVYLNGAAFEEGAVAISFGGDVRLAGIISQGCTPIGETWTITKAERNLIHEIGNRPAYEILAKTFHNLPPDEQQKARGNLFVGLVLNEYLEEFRRGDFLVRNLLAADPKSGTIAVGAFPRSGQTLQFQRRDAATASEDISDLLRRAQADLARTTIYGGCLCSCSGRGHRLFGTPGHDARHVQRQLGPIGLAGFFGNGEIGPVGERNFLHGYTASLGLFVKKS